VDENWGVRFANADQVRIFDAQKDDLFLLFDIFQPIYPKAFPPRDGLVVVLSEVFDFVDF
jgi:hypothetical protein